MIRALLTAAVLLLAGCATLTPSGGDDDGRHAGPRWQQRKPQLEQISRFTLEARLASTGSFGTKADLNWRQLDAQHFELRLSGPFGIGALGITGGPGHVQVRTREGTQSIADPERWIRGQMGWTLPISGLRYWALGLPSPASPAHIELNGNGEILLLEQDGWTLNYQEYQPAGALTLPRRFQLTSPEVTIKVIADAWQDLPERFSNPTTP